MTKPLDPNRTELTFEEKKFNKQFSKLGVDVLPPSEVFENGYYDYDLRASELEALSFEEKLLVAAANKKDMCIRANGFIFAPPISEKTQKSEIVSALQALLDKMKNG